MMTFNSEAAQRIVATMLGRTDTREQKPLTGRIKHLGRQGFPSGTNVRQGNAIAHTAQALSHLIVALALIDRHVVAGAAIVCINANEDVVDRFVIGALESCDERPGQGGSLVVAAGALASLGRREPQATSVVLSSGSSNGLDGIVIEAGCFGRALRSALAAEGVTVPDFVAVLKACQEAERTES